MFWIEKKLIEDAFTTPRISRMILNTTVRKVGSLRVAGDGFPNEGLRRSGAQEKTPGALD
jgi:hypothetical protein